MGTPTLEQPTALLAPSPGTGPLVVGLHGFARSGKDTAAQALLARGFVRIALADPIRQALLELDPIVGIQPVGRHAHPQTVRLTEALAEADGDWDVLKKSELYGPETRRLMQQLGTEVARIQWWDAFWLDLADQKMAQLRAQGHTRFVITDVRFPNEAAWARAHGWPVVRITRPGVGPVNDHSSDAGLPDELIDYEIANDGTIAQLHARTLGALQTVGIR